MKTRPFVISTAVGTGIQILYLVISTGSSLFLFGSVLENFEPNAPPDFLESSSFIFTFLFSGVALVCGPLLSIGLGVLYAYLHKREENSITADQGAIGGGASVAAMRFFTGVIGIGVSLLLSSVIFQQTGIVNEFPGGDIGPFMLISSFVSIGSGLFGVCFSAIFGGALGAIGGALTAAFLQR